MAIRLTQESRHSIAVWIKAHRLEYDTAEKITDAVMLLFNPPEEVKGEILEIAQGIMPDDESGYISSTWNVSDMHVTRIPPAKRGRSKKTDTDSEQEHEEE